MLIQLPSNSIQIQTADGKVIRTIGIMEEDFEHYDQALSAQKAAAVENMQAATKYNNVIDSLQISINAGHGVTAPTIPQMKLVDDEGTVTFAPFSPPLHNLMPYSATSAPSSGQIAVTTAPDLQKLTYLMVKALYQDRFPNG